jgi:hypothetical protein
LNPAVPCHPACRHDIGSGVAKRSDDLPPEHSCGTNYERTLHRP